MNNIIEFKKPAAVISPDPPHAYTTTLPDVTPARETPPDRAGLFSTVHSLPLSIHTAIAFVVAFVLWPADFVRALFGAVDGAIVEPCDLCCDPATGYLDGHPAGEICPHAQIADCQQCLAPVDLDRFGWCRVDSQHFVVNRRPKRKGVRQPMTK